MSGRLATSWRWLRRLVLLALVVWAGWAWWSLGAVRHAGDALHESLAGQWPADATAPPGVRDRLLHTAADLQDGHYIQAAAAWQRLTPPTATQRQTAQRFFAAHPDLRERFLTATAAAQTAEEVAPSDARRASLGRAFLAAAGRDVAALQAELTIVEQAIMQSSETGRTSGATNSREVFVEMLGRFGPGFDVSRTLAFEGHVAVEKLLARARRHAADQEYAQAAGLVQLAARLLSLDMAEPAETHVPTWFDKLVYVPPKPADRAHAEAAVSLCAAMTAAEKPSAVIGELVGRAQRALKTQRWTDAFWWAGVALSALGVNEQAVAATTQEPTATTREER
jgi:hypothetical protein